MPDFLRVVKKFLSQKARLQVCDGWMGGCVCGWGWWVGGVGGWVGGSVCLCVHLFAEVIVMVVDYTITYNYITPPLSTKCIPL